MRRRWRLGGRERDGSTWSVARSGQQGLEKNSTTAVLRFPAVSLCIDEHRFTEDWGIFQVDRAKLGDGFRGNKLDLGVFLPSID